MGWGLLTSSFWYIYRYIIVTVGRMSLLVSVSTSKTETSLSKIVLNMLSLPNERCPDFPFSSLGNYTYLSFCVRRNCHLRAIPVPMLAYFFCLCPFFSHMGISACECAVYPCINGSTSCFSSCLRSCCYREVLVGWILKGTAIFFWHLKLKIILLICFVILLEIFQPVRLLMTILTTMIMNNQVFSQFTLDRFTKIF